MSGQDQLGAVHQGQPLLRHQAKRLDLRSAQRLGGRHPHPSQDRLAFAQKAERQMGERGEIAARADGALLRNHRQQIRVQKGQKRLDHPGAHARVAAGKHMGPQEDQGAGRALGKGRADPGAVAPDQVELQSFELVRRNADVLEMSEAGVDAIDLIASGEDPLDHGMRLLDTPDGPGRQRHADTAARHGRDLLEAQIFAVQNEGGHARKAPNRRGDDHSGRFESTTSVEFTASGR